MAKIVGKLVKWLNTKSSQKVYVEGLIRDKEGYIVVALSDGKVLQNVNSYSCSYSPDSFPRISIDLFQKI